MESYDLKIYKTIIFYIPQKNRNIKKIYYKYVGLVQDIKKSELATATINVYKQLDTGYIVDVVNVKQRYNTNDSYIDKLNTKSEKMYLQLKNNNDLLKSNINIKENYFKIKYNNLVNNNEVIKMLLKDIDKI